MKSTFYIFHVVFLIVVYWLYSADSIPVGLSFLKIFTFLAGCLYGLAGMITIGDLPKGRTTEQMVAPLFLITVGILLFVAGPTEP